MSLDGYTSLVKSGAGVLVISGNSEVRAVMSVIGGNVSISSGVRLTVSGGNYTQSSGTYLVLNPNSLSYYQLAVTNGTVSMNNATIYVNTVGLATVVGANSMIVYAIANSSNGSFSFDYDKTKGVELGNPSWKLNSSTGYYELSGNATKFEANSTSAVVSSMIATYGIQGSWLLPSGVMNRLIERVSEDSYVADTSNKLGYVDIADDMVLDAIGGSVPRKLNKSGWSYYVNAFGAIETKSNTTESTTSYKAKQIGGYLGAEKQMGNLYLGGFYGYTQRDLEFDAGDNETQKIDTVGATVGYRFGDWFVSDIAMFSVGKHDAKRMGDIKASYTSNNIKNELAMGYIETLGNTKIMPHIGLVYDYVSMGEYTDSVGNKYDSFGKSILQGKAGMKFTGEYKVYNVAVKPFLDVSYVNLISSNNFEMSVGNNASSAVTKLTDKFDVSRIAIEAGMTIAVGLDTDMRIAYIGSFGDSVRVHGGSISLKFNNLDTELTACYSNAFDSTTPSKGDYNAFFGVTIHY